MTTFVMLDYYGQPVTDWDFDGPQTWHICPVAPETKGTARAVFSLLVRNRFDAEAAVLLLNDMNRGLDVSLAAPFCKGKVSTDRDWGKLPQNGGNRFEVKYAGRPWLSDRFEGIDRAKQLEQRGESETWYIQVNNDFEGTQRPVFSFVVRGVWEAELVLDTVKILNRPDRPNITQCPFFCLGKVSTQKDVHRFAEWMAKNSKPEALLETECGQHFND